MLYFTNLSIQSIFIYDKYKEIAFLQTWDIDLSQSYIYQSQNYQMGGLSSFLNRSNQDISQMTIKNRDHNIFDQGIQGTCWAYAISDGLASVKLRQGKSFDSKAYRKALIREYGREGQNLSKILQQVCQIQNVEKIEIKKEDLCQTLIEQRVVIASYFLYQNQWNWIAKQFTKRPYYILKLKKLEELGKQGELKGHAVVIVGTRKNYFYAKNSWGKLFGTNGYFRIGRDVEPKQLFDLKAECDYESNSQSSAKQSQFQVWKHKLIKTKNKAKKVPVKKASFKIKKNEKKMIELEL